MFSTVDLMASIIFGLKSIDCLHALTGKVDGGNYSYYFLKYEGPIRLELKSLEGDADIFVSSTMKNPTFDLEEHSLSSWTCGIDSIFVPKSLGRPVNIGIYGHPRYDESRFILTAEFLVDDEYDPFVELNGDYDQHGEDPNLDQGGEIKVRFFKNIYI